MRPSFSRSSFEPCTTRCPRFTCVSDGYPLRRLLLRSKARFVGQCILSHGCLPFSLTSTMGKVTRTHSLVLRTSHMPHSPVWSGRRESNSRHQLGRLRPVPLDHARSKTCAAVFFTAAAAPDFGCGGWSRTSEGWIMRPPWRAAPPRRKIGCGGRTRTCDLPLNRRAPYRLGYTTKRPS